jgi:hypothetical protein
VQWRFGGHDQGRYASGGGDVPVTPERADCIYDTFKRFCIGLLLIAAAVCVAAWLTKH